VLAGNKCDVPSDQRKVTPEEGKKLADEFGIDYFECSAKTGDGVDGLFGKMGELISAKNELMTKEAIEKMG